LEDLLSSHCDTALISKISWNIQAIAHIYANFKKCGATRTDSLKKTGATKTDCPKNSQKPEVERPAPKRSRA